MIKRICPLEGGMMFLLASYERQMERIASLILQIMNHIPPVVDGQFVVNEDGETDIDEIPGPSRYLEPFQGIFGTF